MGKNIAIAVVVIGLLVFLFSGKDKHWAYEGSNGPSNWGKIDHEFIMCEKGKNQSPINIIETVDGDLSPIRFEYNTKAQEILNNGHTVQVNFDTTGKINIAGNQFSLKQIHFHTPSENKIKGKSFPLEGHFVHSDKYGNLAVVAVMFEKGNENNSLNKLWKQLPKDNYEKFELKENLVANELLPNNKDYYRYTGSLTTPPCSEGVTWLIMKENLTISAGQIDKFAKIVGNPNNRPIQNINARVVVE